MHIERWEPTDSEVLRGFEATWGAALDIDDPDGPRMTGPVLSTWLRWGFGGDPAQAWFIPGPQPGSVTGWYRMELPDLENTGRAELLIVVHPRSRRRGVGQALLRHAAGQAAADQRSVLGGEVLGGSAGDAFAAAAGAKPGIGAVLRRLDLGAVPAGKVARLRAAATAAATGYSLVRWTGAVPPGYRESMGSVLSAHADAPHDAGVEAERWDADRVRERTAVFERLGAVRGYTVAAVHDATGELAAMTHVSVAPDSPQWGHQGLTAVTRPHRGHRLGLLLKTAMIEWLAEAEPAMNRMETGNASANQHMIAINDALGFVPFTPEFHTCELGVTAVPAGAPQS